MIVFASSGGYLAQSILAHCLGFFVDDFAPPELCLIVEVCLIVAEVD
jgi:hypothetical protein